MVNQVTPDGSLTYTKNGQSSFVDSTGKTVTTPTYTATTSLSPAQQAIKAQTDSASLNLGKLANTQSGFLNDYLSKPFTADTTEAENRLNELGSARLDPRFAKEQDSLRTQLISSGIRPGTAAYDQQMGQLGQTKNDAYNELYLNGRSQALQEAYAQRNQPLQEIGALMSGAQVQSPQFASTPTASISSPNYMQASQNNYAAQQQASSAKMGGLFGLLSGGIGLLSDRDAKENIVRVGILDNGLFVYRYNYRGDNETHIGLIAQEVEKAIPHAVRTGEDGFKRVRYDLATEMA